MNFKNAIRILAAGATILCAIAFMAFTVGAQEQNEKKKPVVSEKGRDPFRHYEPVRKIKPVVTKLEPPSIQVRIERYRVQKMAAASAHVAPPKPTTALMLNEIQVNGVFRTPRGWAAMVEATPIKLSYVVYPGENFFDGQLVAIEESRLVFRLDTLWTDGHKDKSVEIKPLRQPSPVEAMTANASYTENTNPELRTKSDVTKPSRQEIDMAIRQAKVLIGMDMQDVSKAWGDGHTSDSLIEDGMTVQIWRYSRGEVYFRNSVVYKVTLLKG